MSTTPERVFIGVDVGATKVAAAAVGDGGALAAAVERPTDRSGPEALLAGVEAAIGEVAAEAGRPAAVGIGVPSQVEWASGRVLASVNVPLAGIPLREELGRRLGCPVYVDNDGACAALAEAEGAGGAVAARALVMLTLGTGVGGGIVVDGRVVRGASGLGGELGHLVVDAEGPDCPGACPNRGCLEALVSGLALERDATAIGRAEPDGPLGRALAEGAEDRVTGREAVAAAEAGDPAALGLFERLAFWLGAGMSGLVNAFEPERLVVGGGLSAASGLFFAQAREQALARALPALAERVEIALAGSGAAAGVIGAGLLAAHEYDGSGGHTRP